MEAVLFSRVGTGVGPSAGANPGSAGVSVEAGDTSADTNVIVPGANEISVRGFVTDVTGSRVPGVSTTGWIHVEGRKVDLRFTETVTPDGDLVYDSQRIAYASGDVTGTVLFDFDRNGAIDDAFSFAYRDV